MIQGEEEPGTVNGHEDARVTDVLKVLPTAPPTHSESSQSSPGKSS